MADIIKCRKENYNDIAEIWERSVRASHDFIDGHVISEIKKALISEYLPAVDLYAIDKDNSLVGFIGISGNKIEMLFVDSDRQGCGYGTTMINFAIMRGATLVDVNEQNPSALKFYMAKGFRVIGRDDTDDAGRPYPILHLSL